MAHYSGHQVVAITVSFTTISGVILLLRLFTRFALIRNAGSEDFCIAFAMLCSIALTVTICEQVKYGMGQHVYTLSKETLINSQKPFWASIWIYNLSLTFTKVSILLQYLRIFTIKQFRVFCWTLLGFVAIYSTWTFFGSIFECMPVAYFWDKTIKGGHCMNQYAVWFTNAAVNIVTDFAIIILPMPVLRSLDLPLKQKRALMLVFALGGFVCIVSILRLQSLVTISNSTDPTFDNPPAATWSSIEINVGLICASLPALRQLLSQLFPSVFSSSLRASKYYPQAGYYRSGDSNRQFHNIHLSGVRGTKLNSSDKESEEEILGFQATRVGTGHDFEEHGKTSKEEGTGRAMHSSRGSTDLKKDRSTISRNVIPEDNEIKVVTVVQQSVERNHSARIPQPLSPRLQKPLSLSSRSPSFTPKPSNKIPRRKIEKGTDRAMT